MARFVFRLEPVLRHRAQRQEIAEQALAAAQREREERARALETARLRLEAALLEAEALDLSVALHLQIYREHLRGRERELARDLAVKEQVVAQRLQSLVAARREKKVLENLKEQRRQAFEAVQRSREQKALDEIGMRSSRADIQTSGKEVK